MAAMLSIAPSFGSFCLALCVGLFACTAPAPECSRCRVFITNESYSGSLGGLEGANQKCTNQAAVAGYGGTWRAWLSSDTESAIDGIVGSGPWYLPRSSPAILAKQ